MKLAARWLIRAIALLLLLVAGGTFIPRPLLVAAEASPETATSQRILLLSGPIHTDIAIPLDDRLRASFSFLEDAGIPVSDPAAQWLIFGWGGRSFYLETPTWADLKPMPVFRALTIDRSVMHVDIAGDISETHPAVTVLNVNGGRFEQLLGFVNDSFIRENGVVLPIGDRAYGTYDRFFEAKGYFNALLGCNTWTAAALRKGGLRSGFWNPLPQPLALSLLLFN
ncbi:MULTISPECIES: TIGR02117 family protein [unclassified Rhizobium]|uniref:TIGR02117 family protein n=1 Tax=unclassified Rhizobium TaxID=2613769 RepID=UPI001618E437|nr:MULTISPECIES: TIGR02117 family protein [unclassified Rhizobium]